MFISERLIFLQLQKTGCTHITKLLSSMLGGHVATKHSRLPQWLENDRRYILGSIRNPWDWYISLWAYGCSGEGALYHRLTKPWIADQHNEIAKLWRPLYANPNDSNLFRQWLHLMMDINRSSELGESYVDTRINQFTGFYSFRYLSIFCTNTAHLFTQNAPENLQALQRFDAQYNRLKFCVRNEHLETDLIHALSQCELGLSDNFAAQIRSAEKTNVSLRQRSLTHYYDESCVNLVAEKDQFIIDKYAYQPPIFNLNP